MELTLFAPGLLLPDAVSDGVLFDLEAPSLSLMLGRGRRFPSPAGWLARQFAAPQPLPIAALRRAADGSADAWLCLDPVHWRVEREGIILDDPSCLALSWEEARALCASVASLFATWGELAVSAPGQWEIRLTRSPMLETRALPEASGKAIDPCLPGGPDGVTWRRSLSEAQILLHSHPVNQARATAGRPTVNSLWPWGLGALPAAAKTEFTVCWSQDAVVAGLCHLAGIPCIPPPDRFEVARGRILCHIDSLTAPAHMFDALAWRLALLSLEEDWLAPAIAALKRGRCSTLRLVASDAGDTERAVILSLARDDLWRFWQRPLSLVTLGARR